MNDWPMLGHAAGSLTNRYVHHLDSVLVSAADKVATTIHGMMTDHSKVSHDDVTAGKRPAPQLL
jgi:hypothetical protein